MKEKEIIGEEYSFGDYLKEQREYYGVSQKALAKGLCWLEDLQAFEKNERDPVKSMQERLLARLGESGYDFEGMLFSEDYLAWELQRDLLDAFDNRKLKTAEGLLKKVEKSLEVLPEEDIIEEQTAAVLRLQYMELTGASKKEYRRLLKQTVRLTIPEPDEVKITELVLAIQELNLLLEYFDGQEDCQECRYLEIKQSLTSKWYNAEDRAMLGAKTAWLYSRFLQKKLKILRDTSQRKELLQRMLTACSEAVELLRDCNKSYFLFELLEIQYETIEQCLKEDMFSGEELLKLRAEKEQNRQFYRLFDLLYTEFRVSKETNRYTCFYRKQEIYCINEIIWTRRNMLGLSRENLNLACGKRTLDRLEHPDPAKRTRIQRGVAHRIFRELRLPVDFERAQIITTDVTALRMEKEYRKLCNQAKYEEAKECLQQIKEKIPMGSLINRQYVDYEEALLLYKQEKISKEEYREKAIEILEYTLPYEVALAEIKEVRPRHGAVRSGSKYLTNREITILTNLGSNFGAEDKVYWKSLKEYCEWLEKKCTMAQVYSRYGFVMSGVANQYGSDGRYEESNEISRRIIKEALRLHNVSYVEQNMYNLLWNDRTEKGLPLKAEDLVWRQGILFCWKLNVFSKRDDKADRRLEKLRYNKTAARSACR